MNAIPHQISPLSLSSRLEAGTNHLTLLDVRTPLEQQEIHLPGSRLVPLDQLDAKKIAETEGADGEIVVICRSGARAKKAADKLIASGMRNVSILQGGMLAWNAAGLPAIRGKKVMSLERQVRVAAGTIVLIGVALGALVHPGFYGLSAFVGAGLVFAGITDWCGMGLLLAKAPWNQGPVSGSTGDPQES